MFAAPHSPGLNSIATCLSCYHLSALFNPINHFFNSPSPSPDSINGCCCHAHPSHLHHCSDCCFISSPCRIPQHQQSAAFKGLYYFLLLPTAASESDNRPQKEPKNVISPFRSEKIMFAPLISAGFNWCWSQLYLASALLTNRSFLFAAVILI